MDEMFSTYQPISRRTRLYAELWQHLIEFFPHMDELPDFTVSWKPYRYRATGGTTGYMVWTITDVVREFWEKVVHPLLKELEPQGVKPARDRLQPNLFYVMLPYNAGDIGDFRNWVRRGYWDARDDWDELSAMTDGFDDDYADTTEINESEFYDDEYFARRKW